MFLGMSGLGFRVFWSFGFGVLGFGALPEALRLRVKLEAAVTSEATLERSQQGKLWMETAWAA